MEDLKSQLKFLKEIEFKEIIEDARERATKIVSAARAEAEQFRNRETQEAIRKAHALEVEQLETLQLVRKQKMANSRFQLIETALAEASERLNSMASKGDSSYRNCLEELVVEAILGTEGCEFEVVVHPRDASFVKQRMKKIEKEASDQKSSAIQLSMSDEPLRAAGGIIVRSKDGKQIFNNTLEARLAKVRSEKLVEISQILFEGAKE